MNKMRYLTMSQKSQKRTKIYAETKECSDLNKNTVERINNKIDQTEVRIIEL